MAVAKSANRARGIPTPPDTEPPWRNKTVLAPVFAEIFELNDVHD
jgi:hypothetical protein